MESPLYELAPDGLKVIETLRFDPCEGFARLGLHMDRLEATCAELRFPFDRGACLQALGEAVGDVVARCRLTVDAGGACEVTCAPLQAVTGPWRVSIATQTFASQDPWLRVKTTQRALYDDVRAALPDGIDEVLFCNEAGLICEGTITNIFVDLGEGLLTPPLSAGLLPGVLRQELLASGTVREAGFSLQDIEGAVTLYVGNSLRGLIEARLVS